MSAQGFGMNHMRSSLLSLLAEATAGSGNGPNTMEEKLEGIEVYRNLSEYEDALARLIESVDKFHPDLKYASELIQADHNLFSSVAQFSKYDDIDGKLRSLEERSSSIDLQTREILQTLNECHDSLNTLPSLEQVQFEKESILAQREKVNSSALLDYATKLSKFTKIPPTFDRGTIGPNNFVWPGDDALRRGMLAMASLNSEQLTKIGGEDESKTAEEANAAGTTQDNTSTTDDVVPEAGNTSEATDDRRGSFVFGGEDDNRTNGKKESSDHEDEMDLDLDLFNPDEF
ncbi:Med4 protein [Maudiozyma humilis]|uniref:Mediator of RNA polymerase II transcription subunit 4 n=1 Tax=Maudiozyma humilis TaxID=51915 RepID=A0AAV5RWY8_MAUHU|nr:Med4 protein [Kazachstania humilis]